MILHLVRMRRNVNRNVFNDRKNVSATPLVPTRDHCILWVGGSIVIHQLLIDLLFDLRFAPESELDTERANIHSRNKLK